MTPPEFPFPVRLHSSLPVYGGRVGLAVRCTQQGALVVHLDGDGDVWEGRQPTAWLRSGKYDVLGDETAMASEGETMSELTSEGKFLQYTRLYQATNRIILVNQLFAELQTNPEFAGNVASETIKAINGALDSAFQEVYRPLARLEIELRESLLKSDRPPTEDAVKLDNIATFCDSEHPAWENAESAQKYMNKHYVEGYATGWDRATKRLIEDIVKLVRGSKKHNTSEPEAT